MVALPIYLDNHATTRTDPRVVTAMLPYFTDIYGNPASSNHRFGQEAAAAVATARAQVAELIGAPPTSIHFTSGATESNNLALKGVASALPARRDHLAA
ncbi:MAG TPA: aminotransferase class V-fold PLP-dependent enzyme, partial [Gemmatales bacterium]|nr:aminotransferase class V-fold PLP-dependent enzyme [Gemmatales bacterium]